MHKRSQGGDGMRNKFKVGDVVMLKSGGFPMTIVQVNKEKKNKYAVHWFEDGKMRMNCYQEACLQLKDERK